MVVAVAVADVRGVANGEGDSGLRMIEWKKGYAVSGNVMVLKKITKVGGRQVISQRIVWTGGVNS